MQGSCAAQVSYLQGLRRDSNRGFGFRIAADTGLFRGDVAVPGAPLPACAGVLASDPPGRKSAPSGRLV